MNLALFTDADVFAGTERHILDLAVTLATLGHAVTVACPVPAPLAERCAAAGIRVVAVAKRRMPDIAAIRILAAELRSGRVDMIHAHNGRTHLLAVAAVKSAGRGRVVTTQHFLSPNRTGRRGPKAALANTLHHWAERNTAAFVAISEAVKEQMLQRGDAPAEKITVVHNGTMEPEMISPERIATLRAELGVADRPMVFCAARLQKEKDIPTLIKAAGAVAGAAKNPVSRIQNHEDNASGQVYPAGQNSSAALPENSRFQVPGSNSCAKFFIAGEGDQREECERLIAALSSMNPGATGSKDDGGIHKEVAEVTEGEGVGIEQRTTSNEQRTTDGGDNPQIPQITGLAGQAAGRGFYGDGGIHKEVAEVTEGRGERATENTEGTEGRGERGCGEQGTCLAGQGAGGGIDGDGGIEQRTTINDQRTTGDEVIEQRATNNEQRTTGDEVIEQRTTINDQRATDGGDNPQIPQITGLAGQAAGRGYNGGKNSEFRIQNLEANRSVGLPKSSPCCLPSSVFSSHCSIYLLGFRSDVAALMAACDIFVLPAPAEPFGLVLIEAMAMGKPVIAAAAGGPLEIVADGETGLLFEPGDAASLAAAMRRLLENPDLRQRMGQAGRRRYEEMFTAQRMAENMAAVYESMNRDQ
jgi:glycosyltransferase involved in cell wall biosynthesis